MTPLQMTSIASPDVRAGKASQNATQPGTLTSTVAVVVLNWNGRQDTLECIDSLKGLSDPVRVLVVDNGSTDGSAAAIHQAHPRIEVIETGTNLGYAGGNNVGMRRALECDVEFVLLLNNDTVVAPDLISKLVAAARRCEWASFFSPRIYYHAHPTTLWYGGAEWNSEGLHFVHLNKDVEEATLPTEDIKEVAYACGCALFVRASAIRHVGLLDERFFLTYEEADWCYRAREAGHRSVYVPHAKVWHKVSVSFGGYASPLMIYYMTRNRLLWARKHLSWRDFVRVWLATWREALQPCEARSESPRYDNTHVAAVSRYYRDVWRYWGDIRELLRNPPTRARLYGLRDFMFRRFGNRHYTIL